MRKIKKVIRTAGPKPQPLSEVAPVSSWLTAEQLASRYRLSVRMIFYLVGDGVLPTFRVGHALRFDPTECDIAMRAFRRASNFDAVIEEELAKRRLEIGAELLNERSGGRGRRLQPRRPKDQLAGDFRGERRVQKRQRSNKNRVPAQRRSSSKVIIPFELGMPVFWPKSHQTQN